MAHCKCYNPGDLVFASRYRAPADKPKLRPFVLVIAAWPHTEHTAVQALKLYCVATGDFFDDFNFGIDEIVCQA